jgi:cytochrome c peroxidase
MRRIIVGVVITCVLSATGVRADVAPAALREKVQSGNYTIDLPLGLQASAAYVPEDNALAAAKVELGRLLYFDKRLSHDDTISCATCHDPAHGWAEARKTSQGIGGKFGARNAPTVINRLFSKEQFWDGRAADLEDQAKGPIVNPIEMGIPDHPACEKKIDGAAGYRPLFAEAFGSPDINILRITQAIAAFERTIVSGNSPFDRHQAGEKGAMSAAAVRGLAVSTGRGTASPVTPDSTSPTRATTISVSG